jgi:hypothetical protein
VRDRAASFTGYIVSLFAILLFIPALAAGAQAMKFIPTVSVADQAIDDSRVLIAKVVSDSPGWIVIHIQANGAPGPVIGYSAVHEGNNSDVTVAIDADKATPVLYAMLHTDAGKVGVYEFPGPDVPVMVKGVMVNPSFKAAPQKSY